MSGRPRFILASASPARRRVLRAAGLDPEVVVSSVDEEALAADLAPPSEVARVLAVAKTRDVAATVVPGGDRVLVVGCDSVLELPDVPELAGRALGKPVDTADAELRWSLMGGQTGWLHTGHCLIVLAEDGSREFVDTATTRVDFAEPDAEEIAAYVATGEPLSVAGAFTLDGLGGAFVRGVVGDPSNVIGISLPLVRQLAARAGVPWTSLWRDTAD